jgi:hypothetical protein
VLYSSWLSGDRIHAACPFGLVASELALDRTPGNQLFLFFLSAVTGGLPSLGGFKRDESLTGLDTARKPSTDPPRAAGGGCADTLRPRGLGAGDGSRVVWSRAGCSFALIGGRSGERLLSPGPLSAGAVGVASVPVMSGIRGGVRFGMGWIVGGGGGGERGMAGGAF